MSGEAAEYSVDGRVEIRDFARSRRRLTIRQLPHYHYFEDKLRSHDGENLAQRSLRVLTTIRDMQQRHRFAIEFATTNLRRRAPMFAALGIRCDASAPGRQSDALRCGPSQIDDATLARGAQVIAIGVSQASSRPANRDISAVLEAAGLATRLARCWSRAHLGASAWAATRWCRVLLFEHDSDRHATRWNEAIGRSIGVNRIQGPIVENEQIAGDR